MRMWFDVILCFQHQCNADLKNFVCLEFWFKHAVGGRAHRSLHLQCPFDFPPTHSKRIRSHPGRRMMHNAVQWQWYAMRKWWHEICETSCKAATLNPCQTWVSPLSTHGEKGRRASDVQLCISLMSFAKISQINYLRLWFDARRISATCEYITHTWIHICYITLCPRIYLGLCGFVQGHWNHNVAVGLPIAVYDVSEWSDAASPVQKQSMPRMRFYCLLC